MGEPSPQRVEELFDRAFDLEPPQRAAFLDEQCGGDADLRAAVEKFLDLDRKARTAVTAKMARVVYALVKHSQPYRHRFDAALPSGSIPLRRAVEASGTS